MESTIKNNELPANPYHKIQTLWHRDPENKHRTLLEGVWSMQEFEYLKDLRWDFTEKVDGTNIRIRRNTDGHLYIGGRTDRADIRATLSEAIHKLFEDPEGLLPGLVLYGEGYGAGIQKGGGNYRSDNSFVLFDAWSEHGWMPRTRLVELARQINCDLVPIIGEGTLMDAVEMTKKGFRSTWGDFQAEGIVARPSTELLTACGKRIITKVKCKDFE